MATLKFWSKWNETKKKKAVVWGSAAGITAAGMIMAGTASANWHFDNEPSEFAYQGPAGNECETGVYTHCGDHAPKTQLDPNSIQNAVPRNEKLSRRGNPDHYVVNGKTFYPMKNAQGFAESGVASWYGKKYHGRETSSGEIYDMFAMTAAHKTLPLPSYVRVTNRDNGRSAIVRVNDRGPFLHDRVIDLSYAAAVKLGVTQNGTANVDIAVVDTATSSVATNENRVVGPDGFIYDYGEAAANDPSFRPSTGSRYSAHAAAEAQRYGTAGQAAPSAVAVAPTPARPTLNSNQTLSPDGLIYDYGEAAANDPSFRAHTGSGYRTHAAAEAARYGSSGQGVNDLAARAAPQPTPVRAAPVPRAPVRAAQPVAKAPAPAPKPVAAAPQGPGKSIQITVTSSAQKAQQMAAQLKAKLGMPTFVMPVKSNGRQLYRVRVGPVKYVDAALARVRESGHPKAYIAK